MKHTTQIREGAGWSFWLQAVAAAANHLIGNHLFGAALTVGAMVELLDDSDEDDLEEMFDEDVSPQQAAQKIAPKIKAKAKVQESRPSPIIESLLRPMSREDAWLRKWGEPGLREVREAATMFIISNSSLDHFDGSRSKVNIMDGATFAPVGMSDGPVEHGQLTFQGKTYRAAKSSGSTSSAWRVLEPI